MVHLVTSDGLHALASLGDFTLLGLINMNNAINEKHVVVLHNTHDMHKYSKTRRRN